MKKMASIVAAGLVALISGAAMAQQAAPAPGAAPAPRPPQVSGQVGSGAPEDIFLNMKMAADGTVNLSTSAFKLAWGGYYRFNFVCPPGWRMEWGSSCTRRKCGRTRTSGSSVSRT